MKADNSQTVSFQLFLVPSKHSDNGTNKSIIFLTTRTRSLAPRFGKVLSLEFDHLVARVIILYVSRYV